MASPRLIEADARTRSELDARSARAARDGFHRLSDAAESPYWSGGDHGRRGEYLCSVRLDIDGTCVWLDLSPQDGRHRLENLAGGN